MSSDDGGARTILVTGGTGTLGRPLVARLRADGHHVRVLSRGSGPGVVTGDLTTGAGVDAAVAGVDVVVHAVGSPGHEVAATRTLVETARRTGTAPHLVVVSIVGVDRVPLAYYREKVAVEEVVERSGLPWTIQRVTQFHDLLARMFGLLSRSPVLPVLAGARFQPIDVRDAADRLAELAAAAPVGRAPDLGGPEVRRMADLARTWLAETGRRRAVLPVPLPGAVVRAVRGGGLLAPDGAEGRITFARFLRAGAAAATGSRP